VTRQTSAVVAAVKAWVASRAEERRSPACVRQAINAQVSGGTSERRRRSQTDPPEDARLVCHPEPSIEAGR